MLIKGIFDVKIIGLIICGSFLFTVPFFVNLILQRNKDIKNNVFECYKAFVRNLLISGIFISLIVLLEELELPLSISENYQMVDIVFIKAASVLKPMIYSFLCYIICDKFLYIVKEIDKNKHKETNLVNDFSSDSTDSTVNKESDLNLSRREKEVAKMAAEGFTNIQIAEELYISVETVKRHLATIYSKTGISSRKQLSKIM